ncbi:hypothetical protein GO003_024750 [Methylicorpusculum oleiharenae]|uniref:hypothetical protein n=1 Tax=Methylicorpusculum oleiharenae TaxID=1338687 RepID=UPI00135857BB|nr:hypothetical protein [Methylicorpusculum oleiharenae]MCD2453594.1 hypothetical protein [Methylicorpusculum oleiharenae]
MKNNNKTILKQIIDMSIVVVSRVSLILIAGCAGVSSKNIPDAFQVKNTVNIPTPIPGSALVAIRWPVAMDEKAQTIFEDNYVSGWESYVSALSPSIGAVMIFGKITIGGWIARAQFDHSAYKKIPEDSTYYAMEFYRQLSKYIPESQILLEPQLLTANSGSLKITSLVVSKIPVSFTVDLYQLPHVTPTPFIDPKIAIKTGGLASPKTCGAVSSEDSYIKIEKFIESVCKGLSSRNARQPELLDHFYSENERINEFSDVPVREKLPLTPNELMLFPRIGENFSDEYIVQSAAPTFDSNKNTLQNRAIEIHVQALVDGISRYDLKKATQAGFFEYVAEYDKPLSDKIMLEAIESEEDQNRIAVITQLADLEKQFITKQDKLIADNILDGAFGKSFRATRLGYLEMVKQEEDASKAQLNSLAMSTVKSGALTGNFNYLEMVTNSLQSEIQYQSKLSEIEQSFYSQFGADLDARQRFLEVNIAGRTRTINASDRQSLRKELKQIYLDFLADD